MATRTSVGSGNWGTAGTWDTGIPADGDDVVVASGHTVTFDVDQSAFTTGVKVTITGTLTHTTATGTYCLFAKTGASIVGAGTWNIGTSGTPIPFAAKHTITGAAGWYVDGNAGLTMTVYGAEPSIKYVKLSGDEAIGQTELSVDTDVTGDIWAAGDSVYIVSSNSSVETKVIAAGGIAETTITITEGLTGKRVTGNYVILITRNISIIAVGAPTRTIYRVGATSNKLSIGSGSWQGVQKTMLGACSYATISGGAFIGSNYVTDLCNYITITGGIYAGGSSAGGLIYNASSSSISNCTIVGGYRSIYAGTGSIVNNVLLAIPLASAVENVASWDINNCTFNTCPQGLLTVNYSRISNCTFVGGTNNVKSCTNVALHNCTLGATTETALYADTLAFAGNTQSEDHDGVDGALKAWCKGGVVTSQVTVKPTGYTQAYLLDPESATYPVFFTKQFSVEPSKTVNVVVQLRKDASMSYLPRVYLMASIGNPLAGATPVDTFTMTDSTNTWESDTFTIANSTNYDQDYCLWFVAQNATDNAYAAYDITTEGGTGGGGAVSIQPISGRLSL
jgi:hypothetical protein